MGEKSISFFLEFDRITSSHQISHHYYSNMKYILVISVVCLTLGYVHGI